MVSDTIRNAVWQEILDAARLARYYARLADRHRRKRRTIQLLLMAAAASGIVGVLDPVPAIIQPTAIAAVAILVAWDFFGDYARKAAVLHVICIECNQIETQWQTLWLEIERPDLEDRDAIRQCEMLGQRLNEVTGQAGMVGIQVDARLNKTCARDAYKVVQERFAT